MLATGFLAIAISFVALAIAEYQYTIPLLLVSVVLLGATALVWYNQYQLIEKEYNDLVQSNKIYS
jgi:ATP/ADP translocase